MKASLLMRHVEFAGVDARLVDEAQLRWFVEGRCRELKLRDAAAYEAVLAGSREEAELLVESVVVGETRFFRDASVFAGIRQWAVEAAGAFGGTLRVLSAPCSTGQEAYSVAATLVAAGLAPERFLVDAMDISESALRVARRGVYAESLLREVAESERREVARWHEDRWAVREELKARVRFVRGNLAERGALEGEGYHLVLCRNLFIYLRPEARTVLAESLRDALLPGGRLVIGTADHVPELNALFVPVGPAAAFALAAVRDMPVKAAAEKLTARAVKGVSKTRGLVKKKQTPVAVEEAAGVSAEELYRRALECQRVGNVRLAERRCRQALYVDPAYLPAMELLDALWHSSASVRLRAALAARIHRVRGVEAPAR